MSLQKSGGLEVRPGEGGGAQGPAGPAGKTILNGTTAPDNSLGTNGDFYINTATWTIYGPKAAGAWPAGFALGGGTAPDPDPVASIVIGNGSAVLEGNSGTATFTFPVTRSVLLTGTSSVAWTVAAYGANPADADDFGGTFPSGTVTFAPGESSKNITVIATGDAIVEPDESFVVTLSSPVGAVLGNVVTATGIITNDDTAPGTSTARSASTITRTSANTIPPSPTFDFTRPLWSDGDKAVARWSASDDMSSPTEGPVLTVSASTTSYDFLNPDFTTGPRYWEIAAWSGDRPTTLNWSNRLGAGDPAVPNITSANTASSYQNMDKTITVTANKGGRLEIVGGVDQAVFSVVGNALVMEPQATVRDYLVQVRWVSYAGVPSDPQTITVSNAVNTPAAFDFGAPVTNASLNSTQTRQMAAPISGLAPGTTVPASANGALWSKDGVTFDTAAGTVTNGDQPYVRGNAPAANDQTNIITFTAGTTSDTFSISSPVTAVAFALAETAAPAPFNAGFSATATYSGVSIGAADPTRRVLVAVLNADGGDRSPAGVSIGGVAATQITSTASASIWRAAVPSGTTANIVITGVGSLAWTAIKVFRSVGAATFTALGTLPKEFRGDPIQLSVATPTDGAAIIFAVIDSTTGTGVWTNAVGGNEAETDSNTAVAAIRSTAGTATVSLAGFGSKTSMVVSVGVAP